MQIHLDPIGGVAGDMFVAAVLNANPELTPGLLKTMYGLGLPEWVNCRIETANDGVLAGSRFVVECEAQPSVHHHQHAHDSDGSHDHHHRRWSDIRKLIEQANLSLQPELRSSATSVDQTKSNAELAFSCVPVLVWELNVFPASAMFFV